MTAQFSYRILEVCAGMWSGLAFAVVYDDKQNQIPLSGHNKKKEDESLAREIKTHSTDVINVSKS